MVRVVFAGGGTGGHIFPAIAIAERLLTNENVDVMFVGTKNKIEARVVPQLGYKFRAIWNHLSAGFIPLLTAPASSWVVF